MALLTIITPTFNRARTLPRCFESLQKQTNKNFEWIVVDDGSTDDSAGVIEAFDSDAFSITRLRKENGGKHTALNAAHPFVHGEYVLILDSDDYLTETAVDSILKSWNCYVLQEEIGMLIFLKGTDPASPVCTVNDYEKPVDVLRYRRKPIHGNDCCEVVRADLFLKYPFPVFSGETFIAECALWNRVGKTHQCVYINSVVYICEYLEDGLTKSGRILRIRNPRGGMFTSNLRMDQKNYCSQRIKYGILFACYGYFAGMQGKDILDWDDSNRGMKTVCLLPGFVLYLFWRITCSQ